MVEDQETSTSNRRRPTSTPSTAPSRDSRPPARRSVTSHSSSNGVPPSSRPPPGPIRRDVASRSAPNSPDVRRSRPKYPGPKTGVTGASFGGGPSGSGTSLSAIESAATQSSNSGSGLTLAPPRRGSRSAPSSPRAIEPPLTQHKPPAAFRVRALDSPSHLPLASPTLLNGGGGGEEGSNELERDVGSPPSMTLSSSPLSDGFSPMNSSGETGSLPFSSQFHQGSENHFNAFNNTTTTTTTTTTTNNNNNNPPSSTSSPTSLRRARQSSSRTVSPNLPRRTHSRAQSVASSGSRTSQGSGNGTKDGPGRDLMEGALYQDLCALAGTLAGLYTAVSELGTVRGDTPSAQSALARRRDRAADDIAALRVALSDAAQRASEARESAAIAAAQSSGRRSRVGSAPTTPAQSRKARFGRAPSAPQHHAPPPPPPPSSTSTDTPMRRRVGRSYSETALGSNWSSPQGSSRSLASSRSFASSGSESSSTQSSTGMNSARGSASTSSLPTTPRRAGSEESSWWRSLVATVSAVVTSAVAGGGPPPDPAEIAAGAVVSSSLCRDMRALLVAYEGVLDELCSLAASSAPGLAHVLPMVVGVPGGPQMMSDDLRSKSLREVEAQLDEAAAGLYVLSRAVADAESELDALERAWPAPKAEDLPGEQVAEHRQPHSTPARHLAQKKPRPSSAESEKPTPTRTGAPRGDLAHVLVGDGAAAATTQQVAQLTDEEDSPDGSSTSLMVLGAAVGAVVFAPLGSSAGTRGALGLGMLGVVAGALTTRRLVRKRKKRAAAAAKAHQELLEELEQERHLLWDDEELEEDVEAGDMPWQHENVSLEELHVRPFDGDEYPTSDDDEYDEELSGDDSDGDDEDELSASFTTANGTGESFAGQEAWASAVRDRLIATGADGSLRRIRPPGTGVTHS